MSAGAGVGDVSTSFSATTVCVKIVRWVFLWKILHDRLLGEKRDLSAMHRFLPMQPASRPSFSKTSPSQRHCVEAIDVITNAQSNVTPYLLYGAQFKANAKTRTKVVFIAQNKANKTFAGIAIHHRCALFSTPRSLPFDAPGLQCLQPQLSHASSPKPFLKRSLPER